MTLKKHSRRASLEDLESHVLRIERERTISLALSYILWVGLALGLIYSCASSCT
ncbi:MAG: hypothetical protein ACYDH4_10930 [Candidatus Cryosericum sp.]